MGGRVPLIVFGVCCYSSLLRVFEPSEDPRPGPGCDFFCVDMAQRVFNKYTFKGCSDVGCAVLGRVLHDRLGRRPLHESPSVEASKNGCDEAAKAEVKDCLVTGGVLEECVGKAKDAQDACVVVFENHSPPPPPPSFTGHCQLKAAGDRSACLSGGCTPEEGDAKASARKDLP